MLRAYLFGVKMTQPYHHGNLRVALVLAAEDVLDERGVEDFSLREVARRAGVSPGAPKHHFADVRALLTVLAVRAFDELALRLERAAADDKLPLRAKLHRQGEAYVRFALAHPERFKLIWRVALLDTGDADFQRAGARAYLALDKLVRGASAPALPKHDPAQASTMAWWSVVHGFAGLLLDGTFGATKADKARAISQSLPAVLDQIGR